MLYSFYFWFHLSCLHLINCISVLPWYFPSDRRTSSKHPAPGTWTRRCRCVSWVYLLLRWPSSWGIIASGEGQYYKQNSGMPIIFYASGMLLSLFYNCIAFAFFPLQCPVLIAWGDKDPWEPIELGRAYKNFDSVEDFVVLPDVGHCPQVFLFTNCTRILSYYLNFSSAFEDSSFLKWSEKLSFTKIRCLFCVYRVNIHFIYLKDLSCTSHFISFIPHTWNLLKHIQALRIFFLVLFK